MPGRYSIIIMPGYSSIIQISKGKYAIVIKIREPYHKKWIYLYPTVLPSFTSSSLTEISFPVSIIR